MFKELFTEVYYLINRDDPLGRTNDKTGGVKIDKKIVNALKADGYTHNAENRFAVSDKMYAKLMGESLMNEARKPKATPAIVQQMNGYAFKSGLVLNIKGLPQVAVVRHGTPEEEAKKINKMKVSDAKAYIEAENEYGTIDLDSSLTTTIFHYDNDVIRGKAVYPKKMTLKTDSELESVGYEDDFYGSMIKKIGNEDSIISTDETGKTVKVAKMADNIDFDFYIYKPKGGISRANQEAFK